MSDRENGQKLKVLIVDDSVVYRSQIRQALVAFPWVEIVGAVVNGKVALERIKQTKIDLVILDLEMPEMNGIETLEAMNALRFEGKTIVFSSTSKMGIDSTFEALKKGASDFVTKPGPGINSQDDGSPKDPALKIRETLGPKVESLFKLKNQSYLEPDASKTNSNEPGANQSVNQGNEIAGTQAPQFYTNSIVVDAIRPKIIVIGSSTGGPNLLESVFSKIKGPLTAPIVIVQHMPPLFTTSFAERLGRISGIETKEAKENELIRSNRIYVAPGDHHLRIAGSLSDAHFKLDKGPQIHSVRPAVDPLFQDAAMVYQKNCLGFILTGMGYDGRDGAKAVKVSGGAIVIQDRESSVVYGMPGAVQSINAFDRICKPNEIINLINTKISLTYDPKKEAV